ncbi:MAG: pyridoxamine 5'-phosphate oxidase [Acidobacteria bacterium]|nr:MAG: pyridoxamine 5'-phosphate oxidase [Acidobacteriota bacterium]
MSVRDPIERFLEAANRAREAGIDTAPVALATADASGRTSVRMVLVRHVDERGFVFHTNYNSRKASDIAANPRAALCFHWPAIEEQIRIEGAIEKIDANESDVYFASRPRGSQIGAWASDQSRELESRADLESRVRDLEAKFAAGPVPRPPFWGGLRIVPDRIEFWIGRADRLHDRTLYARDGAGWRITQLYP